MLEIIVAVAIFGVIASIIFPALLQFLEMRERVDEKHGQISTLQKSFQFLANDLRFAANRLPKDEYGELGKTTISINDEHLIDLTANYSDISLGGLAVPRRVRWQLEDGVLQRIQYPVMDPDSETRIILQSFVADVEEVNVEVSHIADGRDNSDDQWEEQKRLPDLLDIVIKMPEGVEYRRVFSMLGANSDAALAAVKGTTQPGQDGAQPGQENTQPRPGASQPGSGQQSPRPSDN